MTSEDGVTTIAVLADVAWMDLLLSLTVAVKVEVPLAAGAPEIRPVDGARVSPAGNAPEVIAHL
jgi:hypothetical protein